MLGKILKGNKAFTMSESLLMISILGGLSLLGGNKFVKVIDQAKLTQYKYDSKLVEELTTIYKIQKEELPVLDSRVVELDEINNLIENSKAYTKEGRLEREVFEKNKRENYYIIRQEFLDEEVKSKLEGTFLTNNEIEIIYIKDKIY